MKENTARDQALKTASSWRLHLIKVAKITFFMAAWGKFCIDVSVTTFSAVGFTVTNLQMYVHIAGGKMSRKKCK